MPAGSDAGTAGHYPLLASISVDFLLFTEKSAIGSIEIMADKTLFSNDSPVALRQPKTDRLILARFLKDAAEDKRLDENESKAAHAVLVKWADLESSGHLAELNETQMQGDFLAQVFGEHSLTEPGVIPGDVVALGPRSRDG